MLTGAEREGTEIPMPETRSGAGLGGPLVAVCARETPSLSVPQLEQT